MGHPTVLESDAHRMLPHAKQGHRHTEPTRLPTGLAPALLTLLSVSNLLARLARVRGRGLTAFLGV